MNGLLKHLFHVACNPFPAALTLVLSWSLTLVSCAFLSLDKVIYDRLLSTLDPYLMAKIGGIFFALATFSLALRFCTDVSIALLQSGVSLGMKRALLTEILSFAYPYFLSRDSGTIVKRIEEDSEIAAEGVVKLFLAINLCLQVAGSILLFSRLGGHLAYLYGGLAILYLVWALLWKIPVESTSDAIGQGYGRLYDFYWEILGGVKEVKLLGLKDYVQARLAGLQAGFFKDIRKNAVFNSLLWALVVPLSWGFFLFVMAQGLDKIRTGDISTGVLMVMLGMLQLTLEPLGQLMRSLGTIHRARSALKRINSLREGPRELRSGKRFPGLDSAIRIRGLRLSYPSGRQALDGVDIDIRRGEGIAIVGASGSGKSSLAHLLVKLLIGYEGEILFDGASLSELDTRTVRERVALLTQEVYLFPGTLRSNLDPEGRLPDERLREVCRIAQLGNILARLPLGLDTPIGAGGVDFSGGERQRVAVARCLARDAEILILDEATSALDPVTEAALITEFRRMLPSRTIISVTHRAGFAKWVDTVYVMRDGRVVDRGSPLELDSRPGPFRDLFES